MKNLRLLIAFAAGFVLPLIASAYDLDVTFRVDETDAKTIKFTPKVVAVADLSPVASPELNAADSVFSFRNLPENVQLGLLYEVDGNTHGKAIAAGTDTMTIYIPAFYLNDATVLKDLTVTASDRRMSAEKETYIPTSKAKRISANGTALIQNIGITTLQVEALNGTISTITGMPVSTFIDFMPASRTDVRNIRAEDVKRVEVYDSPSDPRFGGAQHVVNFVMVQYEFGGYSKAEASEFLISENGYSSLYSKLAYKKMTYDVGVYFRHYRSRHSGQDESSSYRFQTQDVEVERNVENSLEKKRELLTYFRAIYKTDKIMISNFVGLSSDKMPDNFVEDSESFSSGMYDPGTGKSVTDASRLSFSWEGNYQFFMANDFTFVLTPKISYGKNRRDYSYMSDNDLIENFTDEKMWVGYFEAMLQKKIGRNSLSAKVYGQAKGNDIDYYGTSTASQRGRNYYGGVWLQGQLTFGRLTLQPNVTLYLDCLKLDGAKETRFSPEYRISGNYLFNDKHRMTFWGYYYPTKPSQSVRFDEVLYRNQIDATSGNPALKRVDNASVALTYTCTPVRQLSVTAFGDYSWMGNPLSYEYCPDVYDGRDVMIRRYTNARHLTNWYYGVNSRLSLFDNALTLVATLAGVTESVSGPITASGSDFRLNLSARYTFSDFYVSAQYQRKNKTISATEVSYYPEWYCFSAGWGNGNWQVETMLVNPFSTSYRGARKVVDTRYYHSDAVALSFNYRLRALVSVSYSFSYGKKKVSAGQVIKALEGAESQMLE